METPSQLIFKQLVIGLSSGYAGWELTRLATLFIQQLQPGLQRTRRRLVYLFIAAIFIFILDTQFGLLPIIY